MLVVETVEKIRRTCFQDKKSIKQICRELRVSRNTVRKVIRSGATEFTYERTIRPLPEIGPWKDKARRRRSGSPMDWREVWRGFRLSVASRNTICMSARRGFARMLSPDRAAPVGRRRLLPQAFPRAAVPGRQSTRNRRLHRGRGQALRLAVQSRHLVDRVDDESFRF